VPCSGRSDARSSVPAPDRGRRPRDRRGRILGAPGHASTRARHVHASGTAPSPRTITTRLDARGKGTFTLHGALTDSGRVTSRRAVGERAPRVDDQPGRCERWARARVQTAVRGRSRDMADSVGDPGIRARHRPRHDERADALRATARAGVGHVSRYGRAPSRRDPRRRPAHLPRQRQLHGEAPALSSRASTLRA